MTTMGVIGSVFTSVRKTVKSSSGSAVNIAICLVTVGSEQLFSFAAFQCPCPTQNSTKIKGFHQNFLYGWVFIIVPALALFVLGFGMNLKTRKLLTGCIYRSQRASRGCRASCCTLAEICVQALVAPMAWMSVAFLDGKYYACAVSIIPYSSKSCHDIPITYTEEFDRNKRSSQIIGWCLVAVVLFLGSLFYMLHRCLSPLTYHHRKYAKWYRELEAEVFEKKAKEQIKKEVEEETIERFLQAKRTKDDWDKISTVFTFTTDDNKYALYSRLDEWNEGNKMKIPLQKQQQNGVAAQDDSSIEQPINSRNTNNNASANTRSNFGIAQDLEIARQEQTMDQSEEPLIPQIHLPENSRNPGQVESGSRAGRWHDLRREAMSQPRKTRVASLQQHATNSKFLGVKLDISKNGGISNIAMENIRQSRSMGDVNHEKWVMFDDEISPNFKKKTLRRSYEDCGSPMSDC